MSEGLLFSGQGAQHVGMGKSLYENEPIVKKYWDLAHEILDFDLKKIAFEGPQETLTETRVCQPALYIHGYAIFELLRNTAKIPTLKAVLGLSLGELTAHAAAGTYDFETGLKIVAKRGQLMQEACESTNGGMASLIGGTLADVEALTKEFDVDISNYNSPEQIVVSGEKAKIEELVEKAKSGGFKRAIPLNVAGAYHSRLMKPARDSFLRYLYDFEFEPPQVAVYSNTTGMPIRNVEDIVLALANQITSPVRWTECMQNVQKESIDCFYECGPGKVLKGLARRINQDILVESISEFTDLEVAKAS